MNSPVTFPVLKKATALTVVKPGQPPADYLEFLPANLEIIETPASPRASLFLWGMCALLASVLAWSWFAKIDIHAVAKGRIQPSGRSKVVQPLEPGRVKLINVVNGSRVQAGETLLELDPTESVADRDAYKSQLESLDAEILRRVAAVDAVQRDRDEAQVVFPPTISKSIQLREQNAMLADLGQYFSVKESLLAQRGELEAKKQRFALSVDAREKLINSLRERVTMRETLARLDSGSRSAVIDALQALQSEQTTLAYDQGQAIEVEAAAKSNERRVDQLSREFVARQTQSIVEAQRKRSDVEQSLIKAEAKADRTRIKAPIDGTVQQVIVTTIGQVVTTGQPLMVIVPLDGKLEVEALVQNQDIAFVHPGQEVIVKVDSFPFTRYGTIDGVVRRVSTDSVDEREAGLTSDASSSQRTTGNMGAVSRVQNLVYPVMIELSTLSIVVDGKAVPLGPGMMVTAEVRTGSRRVIDFMLAPLREIASMAGRER